MMKVVIFALLLICFAAATPEFKGTVKEQFAQFTQAFGKTYKSPIEEQMRLKIFADNLAVAQKLTEESNGMTQYGVTPFSDLTKQEFSHLYLMKKTPKLQVVSGKDLQFNKTGNTDTTWDWRYAKTAWNAGCISPVYNQGQCGSCWAFSATEQIESMSCLQGSTSGVVQLSMQQIVDCDTTCYGCNGGWTYLAFEYVIQQGGIDTYASYPYTCQDGSCQYNAANKGSGISSWAYVGRGAESTMLGYIQSTAPLSICVDAASWQTYTGGVIPCSCGTSLDHCVQLTGYTSNFQGQAAWIVRNSWGTSWGYSGYLYVAYGCNACGLNCVPTTVQSS